MAARAWVTTRSAAAICSSSTRSSGSNAFSRASQLATATSLSCSANNASRSGCTLPPCVLENLPGGTFSVSFIRQCVLFQSEPGLVGFGREIDFLLFARDLSIEPPRLQPVHRALEHEIGLLVLQSFGLQRFVGACRCFIEPVWSVVGQRLEERTIDGVFELLAVDGLRDSPEPRFARQHEDEERLLGVRRQDGNG